MQHVSKTLVLSIAAFIMLARPGTVFPTSKLPTEPLENRVRDAKVVFVGKVINKEVKGAWAYADLLVEEPLKNVQKNESVQVIWRIKLGDRAIYDSAEGSRGIAILDEKHEGRYWLRDDKFEDLAKLEEVKRIVAEQAKGGDEAQPKR